MEKILVIDDEDICLEQIELFLRKKYEVIAINNGEDGIEYIEKHHKDLKAILLDLMMPDISGLDVLKELNSKGLIKDLKIIMQTGTSNTEALKEAEALGAVSKIIKPFRRADLFAEIDHIAKLV